MIKRFLLIIIMLLFILSFSTTILANEVYERGEGGEVILVPFSSGITGKTVPNATVVINDREVKANDDGRFNIEDVKSGEHEIRIEHDNYVPYSKEIEVPGNEILNLGEIELETKEDVVEVGEEGENSQEQTSKEIEEKKEEEKQEKEIGFIALGKQELEQNISFSSINVNREINPGKDYTELNTKGFLNKAVLKLPMKVRPLYFGNSDYDKNNIKLNLNLDFISGNNTVEKEFRDGNLNNIYTTGLEGLLGDLNMEYNYYFDNYWGEMAEISAILGYNFNSLDIERSELENTEDPEKFRKEYYNSKGFNMGLKFKLNPGIFFQGEDTISFIDLSKLSIGVKIIRSSILADITSTRENSQMKLEGYKNNFDIYTRYQTQDTLALKFGYKNIEHFTEEKLDGNLYWPTVSYNFSGPYIGMEFSY
ncbi:MAG: carboxypeptidase-like regulatory domain-containing protein [Candidatus Woesearchaeota archaeon]